MNNKINEKKRELRGLRSLKESDDNDSKPLKFKWILNEEKSGNEREQNESLERELRPWNAPAPIDEMEFKPKSQESDKHKKEKGKWRREWKEFKKEGETWENTFTQNTQPFVIEWYDEKCECGDMKIWNSLK